MVNESNNLVDEQPVIPVQLINSSEHHIWTLSETFARADEVSGIVGTSQVEESAYLHLLIFICAAAARRELQEDRKVIEPWLSRLKEKCSSYIAENRSGFNLLPSKGQNAFCQRSSYKPLCEKEKVPLAKLRVEVESGNNTSFFTKASDLDPPWEPAQSVVSAILIAQLFAAGGLGGGFKNNTTSFLDTMCFRSITIFRKGETLLETLQENLRIFLPRLFETLVLRGSEFNDILRPIWEMEDLGESIFSQKTERFRPQTLPFEVFGFERMLQVEWELRDGLWGARFARLAQGIAHTPEILDPYPFLITQRIDNELRAVKLSMEKAPWRSFHLGIEKLGKELTELTKKSARVSLELSGIYSDKAKIMGTGRGVFSISRVILENQDLRRRVGSAVERAEKVGWALQASFRDALKKVLSRPEKPADRGHVDALLKHSGALMLYWELAGKEFVDGFLPLLADEPEESSEKFSKHLTNIAAREAKLRLLESFPRGADFYHLFSEVFSFQKGA